MEWGRRAAHIRIARIVRCTNMAAARPASQHVTCGSWQNAARPDEPCGSSVWPVDAAQ
jgi:hypothetical protein